MTTLLNTLYFGNFSNFLALFFLPSLKFFFAFVLYIAYIFKFILFHLAFTECQYLPLSEDGHFIVMKYLIHSHVSW
jgi:hypothetical protein